MAQICVTDTTKKDEIKRWLAINYLLSKYPWKGKGTPTLSLFEFLVNLSEEVLELENDIFRLKNDLAQIIVKDNVEKIVSTESDVLSSIPDDILKQFQQEFSLSFEFFENRNGRTANLEFQGIKEIIMQPGLPYVISEELYRELKWIYQLRILPFISPVNVHMFIDISQHIIAYIAFFLGTDFNSNHGILGIRPSTFEQLKSVLINEFGEQNIKWYFEHFGVPNNAHPMGLGSAAIVTSRKDIVFLPYFSILLSIYLSSHWERKSEKGEFLQYIGHSMEDFIFSFLKALAINTEHPILKKPLLRIPYPEKARKNEEIADVMGYDDRYLIVIESKFWEVSTITSLDIELGKFSEKLDYIKNNLGKFGFPETLQIIPFFYTPFPPYKEWNQVDSVIGSVGH